MSNVNTHTKIMEDDVEEIDRMLHYIIDDALYCEEMMRTKRRLTPTEKAQKTKKTKEIYRYLIRLHYYLVYKARWNSNIGKNGETVSELIQQCIEMCHHHRITRKRPTHSEYMRIHDICTHIYERTLRTEAFYRAIGILDPLLPLTMMLSSVFGSRPKSKWRE